MKKLIIQILIGLVVIAVLGFLVHLIIEGFKSEVKVDEPNLSSVTRGGEYHSTSTSNGAGGVITYAARTQVIVATTTPSGETIVANSEQRFGGITLGSVIIGGVSAADLIIYDATSTSDISSTTAGWIIAAATTGTYTFDVALSRGLILDFGAGHEGEYVITYR